MTDRRRQKRYQKDGNVVCIYNKILLLSAGRKMSIKYKLKIVDNKVNLTTDNIFYNP